VAASGQSAAALSCATPSAQLQPSNAASDVPTADQRTGGQARAHEGSAPQQQPQRLGSPGPARQRSHAAVQSCPPSAQQQQQQQHGIPALNVAVAAASGLCDLLTPGGAAGGSDSSRGGTMTLIAYLESVYRHEWANFKER
jgi:hypothetical protein